MSLKNSSSENNIVRQPYFNNRLRFLNNPIRIGVLTFILFFILLGTIIYQRYKLAKESNTKEAAELANQVKNNIQTVLSHAQSAAKTLSFFIDKNGSVNNFDSVSKLILETSNEIDALQLSPNAVTRYIYPLEGNEEAMAYNILKSPVENTVAHNSIENKEMYFSGPMDLNHGGEVGIIGRMPVFRNNQFWGFSCVWIKLSTFVTATGLNSSPQNIFHFQLAKTNPQNSKEVFYLPSKKNWSKQMAVSVKIDEADWTLYVISNVNKTLSANIVMLVVLSFLASLLLSVLAYRFAINPKLLSNLLKIQNKNLEQSENNYQSLVERVSDAFASIDTNWNFTFLNHQAGEIFYQKNNSLLGKNIWAEFPELVDRPIYHAYQKAMQTQQYQTLAEYYPWLDKWFENQIYPSKDGITIFFKDITEIKQVTTTLEKNEEKYRSLFEQASDGIVITTLEGIILEVNDSIMKMMGYTMEEMVGNHLSKFLPSNEIDNIPLRINDLLQGKNLLYERKIIKKDGSQFYVEINSKLASSLTLIGFIRDITERKKTEEAIKESTERFELVAAATNDIIWDHDFLNNITTGNQLLYTLYGVSTENQSINFEMFIDRIHPTQRKGVKERMMKAIENHQSSISEIIRFKTVDGSYRIFKDQALITYNPQGKPIRILGAMQDITENEKFKNQLIKEKELSDSIINSLPGIFYLFTEKGKYLRWNKNMETLTGYSSKEISKMHPLDFFADDEKDLLLKKITGVFIKGEDNVEANLVLKNKQKIPFYFTGRAVWYEGENCLMGVGMDFSAKQKAEKAILESEEKYRLIIEQASDGIFMADEETFFLDVNSAGCRMLGYTASELKQKQFIELIPKEDMEVNPIKFQNLKSGQSVINERRLIKKDGSIIDVEVSAKMLPDGRYQSIVRDITERKKTAEIILQSEQKYKLMFNNNPLPMWITTLPGLDIIDVNDAAIKQYGYSREEFLKLNTRKLRPAEDVPYFLAEVAKMQPNMINLRIWRHQRKNGSIIHVETYSHQIIYEGQPAWLGLSHDVTEKLEAKALLQKSYDEIRELATRLQNIRENERTKIAREIHDELGQQLTGLKMDLHWLSKKIIPVDDTIISKINESKLLINDTIATVRKIATDLRPSILDDLGLMEALDWQGKEFEKRSGISVTFINNAGEIKVQPQVTTAIFRIYQELLTNISRHSKASSVEFKIEMHQDKLNIKLTDNGIGFDTLEIKNKKTLGLLGIKERTLLLGGTYEFNSTLGIGSVTSISIPYEHMKSTD